jgi:hypothetical protein
MSPKNQHSSLKTYKTGDTIVYSTITGKGWMDKAKFGTVIKNYTTTKKDTSQEGLYITIDLDKDTKQTIFISENNKDHIGKWSSRGGKSRKRSSHSRKTTRRRLTRRRR